MTNKYAMEEYGLSKTSFYRYLNPILDFLKIKSLKQVKNHFKLQYIDGCRINKAVSLVTLGGKGSVPKLLPDEETLVVATAKMKCYASQPQPTRRLAA